VSSRKRLEHTEAQTKQIDTRGFRLGSCLAASMLPEQAKSREARERGSGAQPGGTLEVFASSVWLWRSTPAANALIPWDEGAIEREVLVGLLEMYRDFDAARAALPAGQFHQVRLDCAAKSAPRVPDTMNCLARFALHPRAPVTFNHDGHTQHRLLSDRKVSKGGRAAQDLVPACGENATRGLWQTRSLSSMTSRAWSCRAAMPTGVRRTRSFAYKVHLLTATAVDAPYNRVRRHRGGLPLPLTAARPSPRHGREHESGSWSVP
jgi:hypothetical protein